LSVENENLDGKADRRPRAPNIKETGGFLPCLQILPTVLFFQLRFFQLRRLAVGDTVPPNPAAGPQSARVRRTSESVYPSRRIVQQWAVAEIPEMPGYRRYLRHIMIRYSSFQHHKLAVWSGSGPSRRLPEAEFIVKKRKKSSVAQKSIVALSIISIWRCRK
jgi:hypothetical protein